MKFNDEVRKTMKLVPELDTRFVPAVLWMKRYRELLGPEPETIGVCLLRNDGSVFRHDVKILSGDRHDLTLRYVERLVKFLLWQKGGNRIIMSHRGLAESLAEIYSGTGERSFDWDFIGRRIFDSPIEVGYEPFSGLPEPRDTASPLGRNLDGCRIGFDLGGSDRKCAAVVDGEVVFSEEVKWSPYFEKDPRYHVDGINDSIRKAAARLPRVDAIGGSAAGVYINNEVRGGSLYRGIPEDQFETHVRRLFIDLRREWNVPLDIANDGEVAALAGAMELNDNAVLGISMGTSMAAGYVNPDGNITPWLNELAFVPIDFREEAPRDEWSGDAGCGVQYFSQQAVARLAGVAGLDFPDDMPLPDRLVEVQGLMEDRDDRAAAIFRTIGTCFGYSLAFFREFYDFRNLLVMGRVTTGQGGEIMIGKAREVLETEFPELGEINLCTPDEKNKRHGQAIAAASLPRREA